MCVKAGGWISISAAAQSIPHTPLSDSHIIQCRKSCSSFINIRPCGQKKTRHSQQKKYDYVQETEYSLSLGRKGWLWGNCRLFVQARQCCVCLLLRSLASWLPLHYHRTGIMDSLAAERKSTTLSCAFRPPNIGLFEYNSSFPAAPC